jgi:hypothetical protein
VELQDREVNMSTIMMLVTGWMGDRVSSCLQCHCDHQSLAQLGRSCEGAEASGFRDRPVCWGARRGKQDRCDMEY